MKEQKYSYRRYMTRALSLQIQEHGKHVHISAQRFSLRMSKLHGLRSLGSRMPANVRRVGSYKPWSPDLSEPGNVAKKVEGGNNSFFARNRAREYG
jgi:hypothetical protein